jgi:hypothetical protein
MAGASNAKSAMLGKRSPGYEHRQARRSALSFAMQAASPPGRVQATRAGYFTFHFAEMWFAMFLGMAVFMVVTIGLAARGAATLSGSSIEFQVAMSLFMVAPMAAWMRIRGCGWRDCSEMSAAVPSRALHAWLLGLRPSLQPKSEAPIVSKYAGRPPGRPPGIELSDPVRGPRRPFGAAVGGRNAEDLRMSL